MLAANALPRKPREKRRQRRFLRFLRSAVFYDCIDNTLDEPQLVFAERIKLNRAKLPASGNVHGNIMDKDTKGRPRNGLLTTNKG